MEAETSQGSRPWFSIHTPLLSTVDGSLTPFIIQCLEAAAVCSYARSELSEISSPLDLIVLNTSLSLTALHKRTANAPQEAGL